MKDLLNNIKLSRMVGMKYPQRNGDDRGVLLILFEDQIRMSIDFDRNEVILVDLEDVRNYKILEGEEKVEAALIATDEMTTRYIALNRYITRKLFNKIGVKKDKENVNKIH